MFSKLLAKSLLITAIGSCFSCNFVSAMEENANYIKDIKITDTELGFRILKSATQRVILDKLKLFGDIKNISTFLRKTNINLVFDSLKFYVSRFLDEKYFDIFMPEELKKEAILHLLPGVQQAKFLLNSSYSTDLLRQFTLELLARGTQSIAN